MTLISAFVGVSLCGFAAHVAACGMPTNPSTMPKKTAINNVHVFDGSTFSAPKTVVLSGGIISNANAFGADVVDGQGGYLLPGFIDAHTHVTSCSYLDPLLQAGVTTTLDMGTYPFANVAGCKMSGTTDLRGSGAAGAAPGSFLASAPGFPPESVLNGTDSAQKFVNARVAEGVDYIKVILDTTGPDLATLSAVVKAAHSHNKLVISHASTYSAYSLAAQAGVDIPTHVPLDKPLDQAYLDHYQGKVAQIVPTLIMMQSIVNNTGQPYANYVNNAQGSVKTLHDLGVTIVTGTDANTSPFVPANPPFGESFHEELELLVAAGLSKLEALRAATSNAASIFKLNDRGVIRAGYRADLVLLKSNPLDDIRNSRSVQKVWAAGFLTETCT